jgi:hypothetical protein
VVGGAGLRLGLQLETGVPLGSRSRVRTCSPLTVGWQEIESMGIYSEYLSKNLSFEQITAERKARLTLDRK